MTEPKKKLTPSLPTVEESLAYADGYSDALKAVRELDKAALIQERDVLSVQLAAEKPLREHVARKAITLASRVAKLREAVEAALSLLTDSRFGTYQYMEGHVFYEDADKVAEKLRAALSRAPEGQGGWSSDMDAAPKDRPLLLFARCKTATAPGIVVGWWVEDLGWIECCFVGNSPIGLVPTHWQRLPTFPALAAAPEERERKGNVSDIPDIQLVERAVKNAYHGREPGCVRWSYVATAFALGSTYAMQLCHRFGLGPDEILPVPPLDLEPEGKP